MVEGGGAHDQDAMTTLPGYRDLTPLGRGGYSEVYRGYQEQFDRWVAVKLLTFALTDDRAQKRFLRECRVAGRVSAHPNIVTVYDAGLSPDGRPYLAMELYDQGSIADRLRTTGPFEVADALRTAVMLAGALETAHRAGVLHRDVKPGNVLLADYGQPALTDFGLSIVAERQEVSTGVDALSPHYAPPEVLDLDASGPGAGQPSALGDVYSLAATVYAMLAGRAPHQMPGGGDDSLAALLYRIVHEDVSPLVGQDVPPSLDVAVRAALARDPKRRTPTALGFAQDLQQVQRELELEVTDPVVLEPRPAAGSADDSVEPPPLPLPPPPPPPPPLPPVALPADAGTTSGARPPQRVDEPGLAPSPVAAVSSDPTVVKDPMAADDHDQTPRQAESPDDVPPPPPPPPPPPVAGWAAGADVPPPPGEPTMYREAVPGAPSPPPRPLGDGSGPKRSSWVLPVVLALVFLIPAVAGVVIATSDGDEPASNGGGRNRRTTTEATSTTEPEEEPTTTEPGEEPPTSAPGPPQALPIADVAAPSTAPDGFDACQTTTTFGAANLVDGAPSTAWRMEGDASGQTLTVTLDGEHRIASVGLLPGYAKVDPCDGTDRFTQNRRPTNVTWTFDDGTEVAQPLRDTPELQTVEVDATTRSIRVRIDGVTSSPGRDFTAISELTVQGT